MKKGKGYSSPAYTKGSVKAGKRPTQTANYCVPNDSGKGRKGAQK